MPISRGTVVDLARSLMREKASDSFSPADYNNFFRATYRYWSAETVWPQSDWLTTTVIGPTGPNQQPTIAEYQLPEDISMIFRVYVNGDRLPPTTIPQLEGDVRQIYDNTWRILPNVTVPDQTVQMSGDTQGIPITSALLPAPMKYYVRGGYLGIVPPPAGTYPLHIEGHAIPADVADDNVAIQFPPQFELGFAFGLAKLAYLADDKIELAKTFGQLEAEQLSICKSWRRTFQGDLQVFAQPLGYRTYWGRPFATSVVRIG